MSPLFITDDTVLTENEILNCSELVIESDKPWLEDLSVFHNVRSLTIHKGNYTTISGLQSVKTLRLHSLHSLVSITNCPNLLDLGAS